MKKTPTGGAEAPQQAKAMAALAAVLGLPELFEMILHSLPAKQLYLAQRVSRHFQQAIATSITLQQTMCLQPIRRSQETVSRVVKLCYNTWPDTPRAHQLTLVKLGPATTPRYTPIPVYCDDRVCFRATYDFDQNPLDLGYLGDIRRQQYLTNPPASHVWGTAWFEVGDSMQFAVDFDIDSPSGVKLEDIIQKALRADPAGPEICHWRSQVPDQRTVREWLIACVQKQKMAATLWELELYLGAVAIE